jgi:hypothetical protein
MSNRRWLFAIVGLSAVLHIVGMIRTSLPAQDGLKFLRVAHQFQTQPWEDVVRGSDQHPLYPALVALSEPVVAVVLGKGSNAWRVAAQGVSMLAAVGLLWPLHSLARRLFDERTANLAIFFYAFLPYPAEIGHETLSDSLALGFMVAGLCLGEQVLRTRSWRAAIGCGVAVGLGFLTRPEVALVAPVVVIAAMLRWRTWPEEMAVFGRLLALTAAVLVFVGSYAFVKGEISEKLSLRWSSGVGVMNHPPKKPPVLLPKGLDDPKFDFSPKEESEQISLKGEPLEASKRLLYDWAHWLAFALMPLMLWGVVRSRSLEGSVDGRRMTLVYLVAFSAIAIRHASTLGYLSGRHTLSLVVVSVPWASAGLWVWVSGFSARRGLTLAQGRRLGYAGLTALAVIGIVVQAKAGHPSRWGYWAAGLWLAERAEPDDAVLDTRGWASFVRGIPGYDYWHVRQALSDRSLKYVVVGSDELKAKSRRAATLRAMLAHAGKPVATFAGRRDGRGSGVEVYRFDPPESWEGISP